MRRVNSEWKKGWSGEAREKKIKWNTSVVLFLTEKEKDEQRDAVAVACESEGLHEPEVVR